MWEGKIFCSYTLTRLLTKSVSWPIISMNFIKTCRNRVNNQVRARQVGGRYIDSWEDHGSIVILGRESRMKTWTCSTRCTHWEQWPACWWWSCSSLWEAVQCCCTRWSLTGGHSVRHHHWVGVSQDTADDFRIILYIHPPLCTEGGRDLQCCIYNCVVDRHIRINTLSPLHFSPGSRSSEKKQTEFR